MFRNIQVSMLCLTTNLTFQQGGTLITLVGIITAMGAGIVGASLGALPAFILFGFLVL